MLLPTLAVSQDREDLLVQAQCVLAVLLPILLTATLQTGTIADACRPQHNKAVLFPMLLTLESKEGC